MCFFTLGGAPHNHWPIYWHTQEAPHCHGTQGSRCRKKKKRTEASLSKSSHFSAKEQILSWSYWAARQILLVFVQKGRKVPPWFDRAVKYLDYGSFPDSSYEMPGGVLSYIRRVHTKLLLLLLLLALKTELPIKYSTVHMGGNTQACLHDCCCFFRAKSRLGPKVPHHIQEGSTCVTHQQGDK